MMQPQDSFAPQLSVTRLNQLQQLIENSLTHDWKLCVEHCDGTRPVHSGWLRWDEAFFAVASAEPVIDSVYSCHQAFPENSIRLSAEKIQPRTRLVYWIYNAEHMTTTVQSVHKPAETVTYINKRLASLTDGLKATRASVWKLATLAVMLLATLLLLEEAAA